MHMYTRGKYFTLCVHPTVVFVVNLEFLGGRSLCVGHVVPFVAGALALLPSECVGWGRSFLSGLCFGVFASVGLSSCRTAPPTPHAQNHDEAVSVFAETALIHQLKNFSLQLFSCDYPLTG